MEAWRLKEKVVWEQFGLDFNPEEDQNVYLTLNRGIRKINSQVKFGISLNNFTAMTFKLSHSVAFK
ncbi:hypothetical protein [Ekhidna sp.]